MYPQYNLRRGWLVDTASVANSDSYPMHTLFEHFYTSHTSVLVKCEVKRSVLYKRHSKRKHWEDYKAT